MTNNSHAFATPAPINVVLDIPAGAVQFIASERTDTTVRVEPANASRSRDVKTVERTSVEHADGVLRVVTAATNQLLGPSGSVEVTIELPAGSRVEAKSGAFEFRVVGRLGDVTVEGAYRQIKLDEVAALRLTAIDGDVEVGRLGGAAQISTARGDIRIAEAAGGSVVLKTNSGNISIGAAAGVSATLDAGTTLGRVTNTLKNDGAAELDIRATTTLGDISAFSL
ncbi:DUF4097 family beta strand repeat-containing protein [Asanoa sp. WMMD1127]|uniref:DUF4097 family beta strand repeat-containing protein n=1 Tax=Asanoa sp. WMMD1127 TaxID=3016107 RepID=UPI002417725C|nr:DUF4097 family beta strand repeat-containing protein [Asanoa sp. WMMD1127]MDG4820281.1 DUF4097 family beta strand repeat-containing protein [Asanoa sp. WMMD1127]